MSLIRRLKLMFTGFEPTPKTLILLAIPLIGIRFAFMAFPSLWLAAVLWFAAELKVVGWAYLLRKRAIPLYGAFLVGLGAASNGLVMLANGGAMPVIGLSTELNSGGWRNAQPGDHLLFLADRMWLAGFSPGDLLIGIGILATLSVPLARTARVLSSRLRPALS